LNESLNYDQKQEVKDIIGSDPHHDGIKFSDHVFPEPGSDDHVKEKKDRVAGGYAHSGIHDPQFTKLLPFGDIPKPDKYDEILDLLKKDGYTDINYVKNLAKNPETKRETKIGKFIGRKGLTDLQKTHTDNISKINDGRMVPPPDPVVAANHNKIKDNYHLRVTRHPNEVYGMSADDHPWSAAFGYGYGPDEAEKHRGGEGGSGGGYNDRYSLHTQDSGDMGFVVDHNRKSIDGGQMHHYDDWQGEAESHANSKWPLEEHPTEKNEIDDDGDIMPRWHIPDHPDLSKETFEDEYDAQAALDSWVSDNYDHESQNEHFIYDNDEEDYDHNEESHLDRGEAQERVDEMNQEHRENIRGQDGGHIVGNGEDGSCLSVTGGCYSGTLEQEVTAGSHAIYLHHKGDKDFDKPLARIAIRPYKSSISDHKIIRPSTSPSGFVGNFKKKNWEGRSGVLQHDDLTSDEHPDAFDPEDLSKVTPTMLAQTRTWAKKNFQAEEGGHTYHMHGGALADPDGYGHGVPAKLTKDWFMKQSAEEQSELLTKNDSNIKAPFVKSLVMGGDVNVAAMALNYQGHKVSLDTGIMQAVRRFEGKDRNKINAAVAAHLRDFGKENKSYKGVTPEDIQGLINSKDPQVLLGLTSQGKADRAYDIHGDTLVNPDELLPDVAAKQDATEGPENMKQGLAARSVIGQAPAVMQIRQTSGTLTADKHGGYANNGALKPHIAQIISTHAELAKEHPDLVGSSAYGYHPGFLGNSGSYASHILHNHKMVSTEHVKKIASNLPSKELADLHMGKTKIKIDHGFTDGSVDYMDHTNADNLMYYGDALSHLHAMQHMDQPTLDRLSEHRNTWLKGVLDPDIAHLPMMSALFKADKTGTMTTKFRDHYGHVIRVGKNNKSITAEQASDAVRAYGDHVGNLDVGDSDKVRGVLRKISGMDATPYDFEDSAELRDHFHGSVSKLLHKVEDTHPGKLDSMIIGSHMRAAHHKLGITNTDPNSFGSYLFDKGGAKGVGLMSKMLSPSELTGVANKQSARSETATASILDHMASQKKGEPSAFGPHSDSRGVMGGLTLHTAEQRLKMRSIIGGGLGGSLAFQTAMNSEDHALNSEAVKGASTGVLTDQITDGQLSFSKPTPAHLNILKELQGRDDTTTDTGQSQDGWHSALAALAADKSLSADEVHPDIKKALADPDPKHVSNVHGLTARYADGSSVVDSSFFKKALSEPIKKGEEDKFENYLEGASRHDDRKDINNYVRSLPHHLDNIKNWNREYPSYADQFAHQSDLNKLVDQGHYDDKPHKLFKDASIAHEPQKLSALVNLHSRLSKEEGGNASAASAIENHALQHVLKIDDDLDHRVMWPQKDSASAKWLHSAGVKAFKDGAGTNPAKLLSNPHLDKNMATQVGGLMQAWNDKHMPSSEHHAYHRVVTSRDGESMDHGYFPKTSHGWDTFMEHSSDDIKSAAMNSHLSGAEDRHKSALLNSAISAPDSQEKIGTLTPHLNSNQIDKAADHLMSKGGFSMGLGKLLNNDSPAHSKTKAKIIDHLKETSDTHTGAINNYLSHYAKDMETDHLGQALMHVSRNTEGGHNISDSVSEFASKAGPEHAAEVHHLTKNHGLTIKNDVLSKYLGSAGDAKLDNMKAFSQVAPHEISKKFPIPHSMMDDHLEHLSNSVDKFMADEDGAEHHLTKLATNFSNLSAVNSVTKSKHADKLADLVTKMGHTTPPQLFGSMSPERVISHFQNNESGTTTGIGAHTNSGRLANALQDNPHLKPDHVRELVRHVTDNSDNHYSAVMNMVHGLKDRDPKMMEPVVDHIKAISNKPLSHEIAMRTLQDNHKAPASLIHHYIDGKEAGNHFPLDPLLSNPNVNHEHFSKMYEKNRSSAMGLAAGHETLANHPKVRNLLKLDNPAHVREELSSSHVRNKHIAKALGENIDVPTSHIDKMKTPAASAGFFHGMTKRDVGDSEASKMAHTHDLISKIAYMNPNHLDHPDVKEALQKHVAGYALKHGSDHTINSNSEPDSIRNPSKWLTAKALTDNVATLADPKHPLHFMHPSQVAKNVVKARAGSAEAVRLASNPETYDEVVPHIKANVTPYNKHMDRAHLLPKESVALLTDPDDASPHRLLHNPYHKAIHVDHAIEHVNNNKPSQLATNALTQASKSKHFTAHHADQVLSHSDPKTPDTVNHLKTIAHQMPMTDHQWGKLADKAHAGGHDVDDIISRQALQGNPSTPTHRLAKLGAGSEHPSHPSWGDKSFVKSSVTRLPHMVTKENIVSNHPHMEHHLGHI
jgi:hypothetical protein